MSSFLLCVGCNSFDHLQDLEGAELDARRIYDALTPAGGIYKRDDSMLLLSPTLSELRAAATSIPTGLDIATIYIASHAGEKSGNYYVCLRDSDPGKFSLTALPIVNLFAILNELAPRHANLILDCCAAGGAMFEVQALLRAAERDVSRSASVAFFAASRVDQNAQELPEGGVATSALLDAIEGRQVVQDTRPFLDLIEIGQLASQAVSGLVPSQTPICWGLNLLGGGWLAPNPHFRTAGELPRFAVESISPNSSLGSQIVQRSDELWDEYKRFVEDPSATRMPKLLASILDGADSNDASVFAVSWGASLATRGASSEDAMAGPIAWGIAASAILRFETQCGAASLEILRRWSIASRSSRNALHVELLKSNHSLLVKPGGFGQFYYLPLRVSRLLGWIGCAVVAEEALIGELPAEGGDPWKGLAELVIDQYKGVIRAVSDEQAAWVHLFSAGALRRGWKELGSGVLEAIFADLVASKGTITRPYVEPDRAVDYIMSRADSSFAFGGPVARPMQLLPTVLLAGERFGLGESWDSRMESFDRVPTSLFVPRSYSTFGLERIEQGTNYSITVGEEFWTTREFVDAFERSAAPAIVAATSGISEVGLAVAAICSELLPDRVALFL